MVDGPVHAFTAGSAVAFASALFIGKPSAETQNLSHGNLGVTVDLVVVSAQIRENSVVILALVCAWSIGKPSGLLLTGSYDGLCGDGERAILAAEAVSSRLLGLHWT